MSKKKYIEPRIEMYSFSSEDVITTSGFEGLFTYEDGDGDDMDIADMFKELY